MGKAARSKRFDLPDLRRRKLAFGFGNQPCMFETERMADEQACIEIWRFDFRFAKRIRQRAPRRRNR
jgi:hypothetical protein